MSLQAQPVPPIPAETVRVAQAAFPKGNVYLQMRDQLGELYRDQDFALLYPQRGQPTESPWRLALISVMQFMENLSDRQAEEAVRARIDWKCALSLELTDTGFDFSVLSEFRSRLITGGQEAQLLNRLLEQCQAKGWLKARGKQRSDSTHVLAAIRAVHRFECVGETLRHALNSLATVAPDWLEQVVHPEWFERYGTVPGLQAVFQTTALLVIDLLISLSLSIVIFGAIELEKWVIYRKSKHSRQ